MSIDLVHVVLMSFVAGGSPYQAHRLLARLQDFPTTALTFEAWISSSDFCHAGKYDLVLYEHEN